MLSSELWDLGTAGIEETGTGLTAYFEDDVDTDSIRKAFGDFEVSVATDLVPLVFQEATDRDPVLVGVRFVIVPVARAEMQSQLTPERIVLPIDAAMAFGSGRHETTQLCLEALERVLKPGDVVFDVGCGSGILALAAERLGAGHVVGADIDEPAITVARRHFAGALFVGSADGFAEQAADIVICNITGKVNDRIAADLKRILKPTGRLVLSGFTVQTAPQNFKAELGLSLGEWVCWICERTSIFPAAGVDGHSHAAEWWV